MNGEYKGEAKAEIKGNWGIGDQGKRETGQKVEGVN
jgi:hypothetical protein